VFRIRSHDSHELMDDLFCNALDESILDGKLLMPPMVTCEAVLDRHNRGGDQPSHVAK
jgi:hypothetical protein